MIAGCGARGAINAVIDGLRRSRTFDVRIVGTDADEFAAGRGLVDSFVQIPRADVGGYREAVARVVDEHQPVVVFPLADQEIGALHELSDGLGFMLAALNRVSAPLCLDKAAGLRMLHEHGLSEGAAVVVTKPGEIRRAVEIEHPRLRMPLIAKPRSSSGGRDAWLLEDSPTPLADWESEFIRVVSVDEFETLNQDRLAQFVLMPFIAGSHYTVACVTIQDQLVVLPIRRRRFSPGVTWSGQLVEHPRIDAVMRKLDSIIGLAPIANVQLVEDSDGALTVYEINPRLSTTSSVFSSIGVNVPDALLHELTGRDFNLGPAPWGATFARYAQEVVWYGDAAHD
ncbi:ATP-grasp domain-containing protein [Amycolatopsis sp. NPDC049868]|uniref:ATP-grasp domain-containing protein n=1 Tax=Amycolatopsis sp. NPDC049868 TaxID=3363934 RepID=UPI00379BCB65